MQQPAHASHNLWEIGPLEELLTLSVKTPKTVVKIWKFILCLSHTVTPQAVKIRYESWSIFNYLFATAQESELSTNSGDFVES